MSIRVNNQFVNRLFVYYTYTQQEKQIEFYSAKTYFKSVNIYGETFQNEGREYFTLEIADLKTVSNNPTHINANKRKNSLFVVLNAKEGSYSLYIPSTAVKKWEIVENKKEYREGCVSVSYDNRLTLGEQIKVKTLDTEAHFERGDEPINNNLPRSVRNIEEELTNAREKLPLFDNEKHRKNRERYINLLEEKKKAGYKYLVYCHNSVPVTTDNITLLACVDHYEKSKEYIKIEKLTEELKTINRNWSILDTQDLLKRYKLTKKRSAKK